MARQGTARHLHLVKQLGAQALKAPLPENGSMPKCNISYCDSLQKPSQNPFRNPGPPFDFKKREPGPAAGGLDIPLMFIDLLWIYVVFHYFLLIFS